jgi:fermentation-respiration switch protein FrsA (DUF1100 family)
MAPTDVSFTSDGITLAGHLRLPDGATQGGRPAVVLTGPLSGVKEQVTGAYAERLTAAGYVTLCFDHRNFGASGGEPRQHEDAAGKLHDLRDAVSFLAARPEVDPGRIGCCGVCLGGGYALRFAAFDPRIRAVAGIAGGYNSPAAMRAGMGPDGYRAQLASFAQVAQRQAATGQVEYWAAIDGGGDGRPVVMAGQEPWEYYGTARSASPGWVNQLTALSVLELITADLAIGADFLSPTPLLMVHGRTDAFTGPEQAQAAFDRAGEPKELLWLDTTNHIDLYDVPAYVDPAVAAAVAWFDRHLAPAAPA